MKDTLALYSTGTTQAAGLLDALSRRLVHRALSRIARGRVHLVEGGTRTTFGGRNESGDADLEATLTVHGPAAYRAIAFGGTIGAGRAYMDGCWSADDLPTAVRIFALNHDAHYGLEGGFSFLARLLYGLYHFFRRNTRSGSRKNIQEHYDLGNDFYRLFLDETMMYSCGVFPRADASMREASETKLDLICAKLDVSPEDHLLEIGTGWGGFAIHAATRYGCRVTTTTISQKQFELARARVADEGLSDRIEVLRSDYRDLKGVYDKLVSIEMIEAVGHHYFDAFFETCGRLLRPNGKMLLQAITIADQDFERHRRDVDFIKRYIFPGCCIPSVTALVDSATRASDLRLFHLEDITQHYARTLQKWREAFHQRREEVQSLGFPQRFVRMWDFYLGYCEGGFSERYLGDVHMVLVKPSWRPATIR
jgi:cyclopropane-fatty-acyl-phospholipid synthase